MKEFDFIDGIIRGDAEIPLLKMLQNTNRLDEVPNLIYRANGKIIENKITYVADNLDDLKFSRIEFLDHWEFYTKYLYKIMHMAWPVEIARGCIYNCVNCGGGKLSNKIISNRHKLVLRSPDRVFDDIKEIMDKSVIKGVFYGHGVYPFTEKYFMKIHKLIRDEKIDMHADLEIWRMPISNKFMKDFAKTYNLEKSLLWFSVRSFSESYRKKFTKYFGKFDNAFDFSNKELEHLIHLAKSNNITLRLFWDAGNPYETGLDLFVNCITALKFLIKNFPKTHKVGMWSEPIIITPGCPVELRRDLFGVKMFVNNFKDYMNFGKKSKMILPPFDVKVNFKTNYLTASGINLMNKLLMLINIASLIRS
ncbi:MAG: hypothetical protein ACTSPQ_13235 [Candidatus Helarchaeota archaeon]